MTVFQLISIVLAGPIAIMMLAQLIIALFYKKAEFHIIQAFMLCICIAVMLAAFLGVK